MSSETLLQVQRLLSHYTPSTNNVSVLRFNEDLGMDSLDFVELVLSLENHYHIHIPDQELTAVQTVQDFVACVDRHVASSRPWIRSLFL
ncbi:acyl carrier protein [Hymenobacter tibetensis]|uniref:Acyl carrier protein n=1 Tax=Hymenobacter tibetensis TaxID=497967 RepID=A0ABY4D4A8_9BACT|nr:acyl carrier protein [Hymenobacter tibetensis]UOG76350.1 acyl carrier protein [Hymenobacter tibetensis]